MRKPYFFNAFLDSPPSEELFPFLAKCRRDPPSMERKDSLPKRVASSSLPHQATGGGNLNTSSSSSNSSASPPDFLRQIHAALKHRKPLGTRPVRVLDSRTRPSKSSSAFAPPLIKEKPAEMAMIPPMDSSLTPPSITCTLTDVHDENVKSNHSRQQNGDSEMFGQEKSSAAPYPSPLEIESQVVQAIDGPKEVQPSSPFGVQQTSERNMVSVGDQGFHHQDAQIIEMSVSDLPFAGALEKGKEQSHNQHSLQPATMSTLVRSSCITSISVHSAPTFQTEGAPLARQTSFPAQMVEPTSQNLVGLVDPPQQVGKRAMISEGSSIQDKQHLHYVDILNREVANDDACLRSQALSTISTSSKPDIEPPQASKTEKAARRKKYDSNAFFCVNGKLYQKLGKIGSGGSSEVHKVISADCTIYALKKIKLKGRDYATTYGFCQEIGYLDKLKGKNNIIHLIDYEVTDQTLLHQAMEESLTSKDGRIKKDEYIYMVLEYGEIDLAHMLMQKSKGMDGSSWNMNENWLRFYWQQMLEAVNTIHKERIVHSDLKPANFLLVKGSLKLIDFGIAKAIMSDTTNIQRDAQVGTLNYMSPEAFMWNEQDQTGGTIKCGRPSDIWSLGCILYQMVYGKTPFADYKTFWAKFKVITDQSHEITYEPVANPWLIDLMKRCLAWDRAKRWRIPQLLQHPFLVPPIPREAPFVEDHPYMPREAPFEEDHPYELLFRRAGLYRNEPEVSRLCSELLSVVSRLETERESLDRNRQQEPAD